MKRILFFIIFLLLNLFLAFYFKNDLYSKGSEIKGKETKLNKIEHDFFQIIEINDSAYSNVEKQSKIERSLSCLDTIKYYTKDSIKLNLHIINKEVKINFKKYPQIEYQGFYSCIDSSYLLIEAFYEGEKYKLYHRDEIIELYGVPIISNNKKYFACIKAHGLEDEPMGIQVWGVSKNHLFNKIQLTKILELRELFFSPESAFWDKNNNLIVKSRLYNNDIIYHKIIFCHQCDKFISTL